jgi:Fe-S-cluster containining protein
VPEELTEKVNPYLSCMKGTFTPVEPRCVALKGEIGRSVHCQIYENRSSSCRNFEASFESGIENPRCAEARIKKGLPALTLEDWKPIQ